MKKKIYISIIVIVLLFSTYVYWQNRYIELHPVISKRYDRQIVLFQNDYYRFAKPNEISPSYYKNIKWILDDSSVDYIQENGVIYVRNKFLNDMEMVWNYTNRATSTKYFELKKEMDSINLINKKERVDSRREKIESILKTIKIDSIKFYGDYENKKN
ncbi:hypothetical protein KHA90_23790 [Flavobacterium psychroterrae]|uniref:DUF4230 domain-containing protein n=1 Tax=Flavobacterium psychroterrae TaxID=2133767 RepID=A0ABS5PI93_9FLAO|nr:hypothetical protein [Flavobacterium psychroterrae]MBS7234033.1 hypothetical protein [Flavobacterium psychroterrae]